jgi:hypothetical protein
MTASFSEETRGEEINDRIKLLTKSNGKNAYEAGLEFVEDGFSDDELELVDVSAVLLGDVSADVDEDDDFSDAFEVVEVDEDDDVLRLSFL